MISLEHASQLAAIISAMADLYTIGRETFGDFLRRRMQSPSYESRGEVLQKALSSYDDEEIESIDQRIKSCRRHFIEEGSGVNRKRCLCSVLGDVKDGNGGSFPFQEWEDLYKVLGCKIAD